MYQRIADIYQYNNWLWNVNGTHIYPTAEDIEVLVKACAKKLLSDSSAVSQIEIGEPGRLIVRKEDDVISVYTLSGRI